MFDHGDVFYVAVCTDCHVGGNYTAEEMKLALVILAFILISFLTVCICQIYQRVLWEMDGDGRKRPMPCAPYARDMV